MVRPILTSKKRKDVKCSNCGNIFKTTKKKDIQCGSCGDRFDLEGNQVK